MRFGIVGMGGGALRAERLARKRCLGRLGDRRILRHDDCRRRVVVLVGKVDLFLALGSDRHGCDDGVELLGDQRRNDAVPVLRDEGAFGLHFRAQCLGDVDVEARQRAVRCKVVEGRVGAFRADNDLFAVSHGRASHEHENGSRCGGCQPSGNTHDSPLCWPTSGFLFFTDANFCRSVCLRLRRYSYSFPVKINRKATVLTGKRISTADCGSGSRNEHERCVQRRLILPPLALIKEPARGSGIALDGACRWQHKKAGTLGQGPVSIRVRTHS
ncbi:hypothetical protein D9M72_496470 [compost metagenome]